MIQEQLVVGPLQCNCMILICEKTREAVVIDPGDEAPRILKTLEDLKVNVRYLLHTHAHFDHIGATAGLKATLSAPSCLHRSDELIYNNLPMQGKMFGMEFLPAPPVEKFLEDEEILSFGENQLQVIHTPGHSPGSVCFRLLGSEEVLYSGDTLFYQSIGRSDLWGGDQTQLVTSIKNRLLPLNGDLPVFPGHGPRTRIGDEKKSNPFLV
jgi:hydroxyacylglutathione hydrolase